MVTEPERLRELMARAARGYEDSFAEFYDVTAARVYGVALRIVRSPESAADVTQDTYVEAWRRAASYRPQLGSALSWLLTIAHHRSVDLIRANKRRADREERYGRGESLPELDVVWDGVSHQVDVERVRTGLRSLTDVQREALTLAYFGGNTHRQVARMLDLPLGTAKTRIRDGLIGLRDALGVES